MTTREARNGPVADALLLLPAKMTSAEAEVMLLSIGLQESRFEHRRQLVGSPLRPPACTSAAPAGCFYS